MCLGHQAIGQAFGGKVSPRRQADAWQDVERQPPQQKRLPGPAQQFRGHTLSFAGGRAESLPAELEITAETEDGTIMGLAHKTLPIAGVQFHPESIASEHGHKLLGNFLTSAGLNKLNTPKVLQ